jgi:NAD(P)-dependent dehydrogenase (short-subunit alcohol dehydrogenase family)
MTVLVPAFNEAENLAPTIERLIDALTITIEDFEIIIVNDGSTDNTREIAEQLVKQYPMVRVIHNEQNKGLGYSYKRGYSEANKEFFVYIPGDNTWPYRSFVELFGNLGRAEIITSYSINPEVRPPGRRIISRLYTHVMNLLFAQRLQYFNGLTIYPVSFLRLDPASTFGFGFQAEVLIKALYAGLSYIEVGLPIDERSAGASKAVTLRNIVSVLETVFKLFYALRIQKQWRSIERNPIPNVQMLVRDAFAPLDDIKFDADSKSQRTGDVPVNSDRTIVVIGASSGIGAAISRELCNAGNVVLACSRDLDRLGCALADSGVTFAACDAADERSVAKFVEFVQYRSKYIDVLINCAGAFGEIGSIDKVDSAAWIQTISSNLLATFLPCKLFLPLLQQSKAPQIINFSGGGAFYPFPNFTAYACAKAAIIRLTETLAIELAPHGISVNAIAPGFVRTDAQKSILNAGPDRAGAVQFRRAERLMKSTDIESEKRKIASVYQCIRALMSPSYYNLTGKTISTNFDPWSTDAFREHIDDITRSDLYTLRRTNLVNLPEGLLKDTLTKL